MSGLGQCCLVLMPLLLFAMFEIYLGWSGQLELVQRSLLRIFQERAAVEDAECRRHYPPCARIDNVLCHCYNA